MIKTIFDRSTRNELINRVHLLKEQSFPQWGKMNSYQMLKHCTIWDEWVLGKNNPVYKQEFLGLIFGRMALKGTVNNDRPLKKNMPAGRGFVVKKKSGDFEQQKEIWLKLLTGYEHFSNTNFKHDFFGRMTREEIGILAYKHTDHHLRQFQV
jgi:hypothetical protein